MLWVYAKTAQAGTRIWVFLPRRLCALVVKKTEKQTLCRSTEESAHPLLLLPVLIFNHSIHDLLHFFGEVGGVWGELFGGRPAALFLLFAIIIFVPAAGAGSRGGRANVNISLAFAGRFLLTNLLLDLLQRTLLYSLRRGATEQPLAPRLLGKDAKKGQGSGL